MTRITLLALLFPMLLVLTAGSSNAQFRVISGEHSNFSRLVLLSSGLPSWELGRVGGGYELRLTPGEDGFDTREVFDMIPRTRVTNLQDRGDNRLFIGVGRGELLPFASVYMTGFLNEKPLATLRNDMVTLGVERSPDVFADYLATRIC